MALRTTRGNVKLTEEHRMEVLGLISIAPPGPWMWHTEDMADPKATGAIFRCYEEGNDRDVGYLLVADVSNDPDEPDMSSFGQKDVEEFDHFLEEAIRRQFAADGRRLVGHVASSLSTPSVGKGLTTNYVGLEEGKGRQYIDLRICVDGRKVIIGMCYDVAGGEHRAKALVLAMQDAALNGRLR